ncbi:PREDICTED: protein NRT1/ PTR FAMILY 1.3-like [Camelina sativa]|uniref:Protein NRT1/ PTR FAMILY 1.3-like n=1 Tax=Camelina sativa TaxID=90675 RepID=A0ABM0XW69_CAMSA|nr:PREDICTED: protein NRT1/ PTR FAMILY 1.3-like [Camelina sativa]
MDQEALLVGRPISKRSIPTIPFILASQALEVLAYFGLVPNMILFLTVEYGMGTAEAANIIFLWSAATNFFPLVGAFIADSYTGRFPLIGFGSSISLLGMIFLWLTTTIRPECDKSTHVCQQPTSVLQLFLLYSFFALTAIGAGGVRSSCLAFAADQLQPNHTSRTATSSALETLFNWYYFSVMLACFLSQSLLVFVQTTYGWQIGFGVSVAAMVLSVALFFAASPYYVRFKCESGLVAASQALEVLAYFGLVPNMILFLTVEYGMGTAEAANIIFLWSAATNFFPLVGAFIADSYTGRFPLIGFGSSISLLGMIFLWLTTTIRPECDKSTHVCQQPTSVLQLFLLYSFFALTAIGAGGVRSSCLAFAADQLQPNHTSRTATSSALETLFNWYYFSVMLACFLSQSLLVFVQTTYGWQIGFGVSVAAMVLSVALFFAASPYYVRFKCESGLVAGLFQVLVAAYRNRHVDLSSEEHIISYHHERGSSFLIPSQKLRYLNKACVISNPKQDLTLTGNSSNPWQLCRVQQVEDLKSLINVLPIWSTGIILSLVTGCQVSFIVLQAKAMDRRTFIQGFQIPSGSYGIFLVISFVLFLVLYDLVIVPLISWIQSEPFRLGVMVRMGAGYAVSVLCISTLAAVEHARKQTSRDERGTMLSAMWLLPYMILGGISEALNAIAQNEFFYSELPKSMSSVATTLSGLGMSAASLLSSWIITIVDIATYGSWITENIDEGHLDYYYWLLVGLSVLNVFNFVWCTKSYGKCNI